MSEFPEVEYTSPVPMLGCVGLGLVGLLILPLSLLTFTATRSFQGQLVEAEAPSDTNQSIARPRSVPRPSPAPMSNLKGGNKDAPAARPGILIIQGDPTEKGDDSRAQAAPPPPPPGGPAAEASVRQWFPEAFLWRPSVVTENGSGTLDVRVPDQLTDWRVLALAHDRTGHQAGSEHTFASVLPVSVDPVTPGWLYVGDTVTVASQASAMDAAFSGRLVMEAEGALSGSTSGDLALVPGGSQLVQGGVVAERSGLGSIRAEIFDSVRVDGAEREVDVRPTGLPVEVQRGGALSGARTLVFDDAEAIEQRVSMRVFPGPLSVFQAELERVAARPPGAYGYALIEGVRKLSASAGVDVDEAALRTLRIRSWQRLVRESRSPDGPETMALLTGLRVPEDDPLASLTYDRLVRRLEGEQRGDGTWSRDARTTASHVIVQTAASARALPASSTGARLRASGALERLLPNVDDRYTAAWMLASGVVDSGLHAQLQTIVLDGIEETPEGRHVLKPVSDRQGPAGRVLRAEELAVTSLALADRTDLTWRGDLLSELLQGWSATRGLGGGWSDALALQAIQAGLPTLAQPVQVLLAQDGTQVGIGQLDPKQPNVPVVLDAVGGGTFTLRTEPAVPGLVFVATHTAWRPFTGQEGVAGVEVEVSTSPLTAGEKGTLRLVVSAPSGAAVSLSQGIPAGMVVEVPPSTAELLTDHTVLQDHVELTTRRFDAGGVVELELDVTPMFPGQMATRPLEVTVRADHALVAPHRFMVAR